MIVFDAAEASPEGRAEAFHAALNDVTLPTVVTYDGPGESIQCRIPAWHFGAVILVATTGTRLRLQRGLRRIRVEGPPAGVGPSPARAALGLGGLEPRPPPRASGTRGTPPARSNPGLP